jgi:hypothetical protein
MKYNLFILALFCACTSSDVERVLVSNQNDSLQLKGMLVYIDREHSTLEVQFSENHTYTFLDFESLNTEDAMDFELEKVEKLDDFNLIYRSNGKGAQLPIKYEQVMNVCGSAAISGKGQTVTPEEVLSYEPMEYVEIMEVEK